MPNTKIIHVQRYDVFRLCWCDNKNLVLCRIQVCVELKLKIIRFIAIGRLSHFGYFSEKWKEKEKKQKMVQILNGISIWPQLASVEIPMFQSKVFITKTQSSRHSWKWNKQNLDTKNSLFQNIWTIKPNRRELIVFPFSRSRFQKTAARTMKNSSRRRRWVFFFSFWLRFRFKYFDRRLLNEQFHFILIGIRRVNNDLAKKKKKSLKEQRKRNEPEIRILQTTGSARMLYSRRSATKHKWALKPVFMRVNSLCEKTNIGK